MKSSYRKEEGEEEEEEEDKEEEAGEAEEPRGTKRAASNLGCVATTLW